MKFEQDYTKPGAASLESLSVLGPLELQPCRLFVRACTAECRCSPPIVAQRERSADSTTLSVRTTTKQH